MKVIYEKSIFQLITIEGGVFTPTRHNSFLSNIFWHFMILIVFYTYFWPIKAFKSANITLEVPETKVGVGVKTPPPPQ